MGGFHGFPVAALDFYDDLELDNTKSFWAANKHIYDEADGARRNSPVMLIESPHPGRVSL